MKHFLLSLLLLGAGTAAAAQDTPTVPPQIVLSVGPAFPLGSFSSTSFDRDYPAFGDVGVLAQLSYLHALKPNVGVGATAGFRRSPFKEDAFVKSDDELVLRLESTPWQTGYVLADLQFQVPFADGLAFVRGSAGGSYSRSASLQVQTPFGPITRDSDSRFAPAFGLGSGMRGQVNRVVLGIEVNLLFLRPEFDVRNQRGETEKLRQPMNSASFSVVAGYQL